MTDGTEPSRSCLERVALVRGGISFSCRVRGVETYVSLFIRRNITVDASMAPFDDILVDSPTDEERI